MRSLNSGIHSYVGTVFKGGVRPYEVGVESRLNQLVLVRDQCAGCLTNSGTVFRLILYPFLYLATPAQLVKISYGFIQSAPTPETPL